MKTVKQDILVSDFLKQYPREKQDTLHVIIQEVRKITGEVPAIWGKDIIGFGEITYSNTKLKDQPFFNIGLRMAANHVTLYLNAYDPKITSFADAHGIKHGVGCFHIKKAHEKLDHIKTLVTLSLKKTHYLV